MRLTHVHAHRLVSATRTCADGVDPVTHIDAVLGHTVDIGPIWTPAAGADQGAEPVVAGEFAGCVVVVGDQHTGRQYQPRQPGGAPTAARGAAGHWLEQVTGAMLHDTGIQLAF